MNTDAWMGTNRDKQRRMGTEGDEQRRMETHSILSFSVDLSGTQNYGSQRSSRLVSCPISPDRQRQKTTATKAGDRISVTGIRVHLCPSVVKNSPPS
jgi:hypothetical protein